MNEQEKQQIDTQPLEEYAAMLVAYMIDQRVKTNTEPYVATLTDLQNKLVEDFKEVMRGLCRADTLRCAKGLNGVMFEFTPSK